MNFNVLAKPVIGEPLDSALNTRVAFIAAILGVAAASYLGLFCQPVIPTSTVTFLGMLFLHTTPFAIVAPLWAPLMFTLWCWPLLRGEPWLPVRSLVLGVVVALLTIGCFLDTTYALTYHGVKYVTFAVIGNVVLASTSALFALQFRRTRLRSAATLFHITLFVWMASYAFPYLGEYP